MVVSSLIGLVLSNNNLKSFRLTDDDNSDANSFVRSNQNRNNLDEWMVRPFGREVMFRVLNSKRDWTEMVSLCVKDRVILYVVCYVRLINKQVGIYSVMLKIRYKTAIRAQFLFLIEET